ncbi:MAG TPA: tetratricopeptide repeat protein, partial [Bryobacteraceae bacterium]|nr:tetratricopeptide repeat protein [Bryobacteraceae bacterium]
LLRRAQYVVEKLPGAPGTQLGLIYTQLSAVAMQRNKLAVAAEDGKKALDILAHQKWPDERGIAAAQVNLAEVYLRAKRLKEADQLFSEAIPKERQLAPQTRLLADGIRRLASLRAAQQRWREAQELLREAIGIYELRLGADNPVLVPALRDYAEVLKHDGGSKAEIRDVQTRARSILGFAPPHS